MTNQEQVKEANKGKRDALVQGSKAAPSKHDAALAMIDRMLPKIELAMPKTLAIDAGRFAVTLRSELNRNPKLAECKPATLALCIMDAARLGLEVGPAFGQYYLIPRGNDCTGLLGYRGMIELALRGGDIEAIEAEVIHENDHYVAVRGMNQRHEWARKLGQDRGKPIGAYAAVRYKDGGYRFAELDVSDIERARASSQSASSESSPWRKHWQEMWKKTAVRSLLKYVRLSAEVIEAMHAEDERDTIEAAGESKTVSVSATRPKSAAGDVAADVAAPTDADVEPTDADVEPAHDEALTALLTSIGTTRAADALQSLLVAARPFIAGRSKPEKAYVWGAIEAACERAGVATSEAAAWAGMAD